VRGRFKRGDDEAAAAEDDDGPDVFDYVFPIVITKVWFL
jgi:hypothetical protein